MVFGQNGSIFVPRRDGGSGIFTEEMREKVEAELDVIAVGAHPDDVEIACGGTLAKLVQQGYRVGIVDLTDGEPTPHSAGPEMRWKEATAAADALRVHQRVCLELPNRKLMDNFKSRVALAKVFRQFKPKLVIGFGDKTPMASPDHYQAAQITDAAVFYSRLTKWDEQFDDLPVHSVRRQLYFRLAVDPMNIAGNPYHTLVDITDTLEAKIESVQCYASQFNHKPGIVDRIRSAAIYTGSLAGAKAAEAFAAAKPFATKDLMTTLSL